MPAIEGDNVVVSSSEVPKPVAARYAWQANPEATLFNGAGLPGHPIPEVMRAAAQRGNSTMEQNMKATSLIRLIFLARCVLLAPLGLGGLRANSEGTNTVSSKGRTIDAVTTFEGTATHYTRRGKDKFSVGYYLKDGSVIKEHSLLAEKDEPVSKLDLDIVAKGEAFDSVIATGKGTDLTLTGTIAASDEGDGKNASDFSGLGAQIVAADYARVKLHSMKIDTTGFLRAAFISDNHAQILVED